MPTRPTRNRFVYFIGTVGAPFVKIGMTDVSVADRVAGLQTGCPYDLTVLHVLTTPDAGHLETILHDRFSEQHVRGEWYYLDGPVSEYLSDLDEPCLCVVCTGASGEFRCTTCRTTVYRTDWLLADPENVICYDCTRELTFNSDQRIAESFDQLMATSRWHVDGFVAT